MGAAASRQVTLRPAFVRVIRFASDSTSRCFMIAGNDIANGVAISLIESASCSFRRARIARRVGSASAAKVRSSTGVEYLTMWLSVDVPHAVVNPHVITFP
jgi:hypothetical protein